jgi:hypothetical protein
MIGCLKEVRIRDIDAPPDERERKQDSYNMPPPLATSLKSGGMTAIPEGQIE